MEAAVLFSSRSPPAYRSKVVIFQRSRNTIRYNRSSGCCSNQQPLKLPTKPRAARQFGEPKNITGYVDDFADTLHEALPEPVKRFPWREAKDVVVERSLSLAGKALKWCGAALFAAGSVSDLFLAVSISRELLVPVGLFIGIALADFLVESSLVLFQRNIRDDESVKHLLGVGLLFALIKLIALSFKLQGRVLLSHVGNGGLMQVIWLGRKSRWSDDIADAKEQTREAPSPTK